MPSTTLFNAISVRRRWISALRALRFDEQVAAYLRDRPAAMVVGLGEGLETQFHRVDNGQVRWLAVDLPETIELRRQFMPDTDRHRNLACSAFDPAWMDEVDSAHGVIITAQGLFMYFEEAVVRDLVRRCAERFAGGWLVLDTIPRAMSEVTVAGMQKTPDYRPPPMPWGLDAREIGALASWHRNIRDVTVIEPDPPCGFRAGLKSQIKNCLKRLMGRALDNGPRVVRLRFEKP